MIRFWMDDRQMSDQLNDAPQPFFCVYCHFRHLLDQNLDLLWSNPTKYPTKYATQNP